MALNNVITHIYLIFSSPIQLENSGENQRRREWREGERKEKKKEKEKRKEREKVINPFTKVDPLEFLYTLMPILKSIEEFMMFMGWRISRERSHIW